MKMPSLLIAAFVLVAQMAAAREISSAEAGRAASAWARRASAEVSTTQDDNGVSLFHVVRMAGGGAVVTSAESGVTPIVAFLDGEAFDKTDGNPLWGILKADMAARMARIEAVRGSFGGAASRRALKSSARQDAAPPDTAAPFAAEEAAWAALLAEPASGGRRAAGIDDASGLTDLRVSAILATKWDQVNGAGNYYTPPYTAGDSRNYPCGCVALAGAQIAYFWQFPTEQRPQVTRTCYISDVETNCTTFGGAYDWSNMPPSDFYSSPLSTAQRQAAGKLCYDFGVATCMNWGPNEAGGSGTVATMLAEAFTDVFGYANAMAYTHFDGNVIPDDLVEKAVLANLDAGCPAVVSLAGHSVVADGYGYSTDTLYTHLNFGWSGLANAWYNLPDVDDSAGTGYTSSILNQVVYNIFPELTGELLTGRVLDANGDPVSGATVIASSGSAAVNGTTNMRGIYALHVAGGRSWTVTARNGADAGSTTVAVASSSSAVIERTASGSRVYSTGTIGNSWGNDITLGVDVPVDGCFYVDEANGADANDGRSWESAKASIQAAIDIVEVNADTNAVILVNDGRYEPITATNGIPFQIISVNGPEATIIDGSLQWARGVTNRCAMLGSAATHTNTLLSGFCLTNGIANGVNGGGSFAGTLKNCTISGNIARNGGGCYYGRLVNCTISDNRASNGGGSYYGMLTGCLLSGNTASGRGGGYYSLSRDYTLTRCTITNNTAVSGGGTYNGSLVFCYVKCNSANDGGGAYDAALTDCTVSGNVATNNGGGVYNGSATRCGIVSNRTIGNSGGGSYDAALADCVVVYNSAGSKNGGGAYGGSLTNCTVFANSAASGGGVYFASIANCIVCGNEAQTYANVYASTSRPCLYSCLGEAVSGDVHVGNIVTNDPCFVDAPRGDFHLVANSPCINAGTNELVVGETDFYGDTRIVGERVDMGASEFQQVGGYASWAAENGLGAAEAMTEGVPNLIRYVFNRPSGAFSPFTGLTFQDGDPVVWFPSFNSDVSDVSLSILSTTDLMDWENAVEFLLPGPPFTFGGIILHHSDTAPARFYRLKVRQ